MLGARLGQQKIVHIRSDFGQGTEQGSGLLPATGLNHDAHLQDLLRPRPAYRGEEPNHQEAAGGRDVPLRPFPARGGHSARYPETKQRRRIRHMPDESSFPMRTKNAPEAPHGTNFSQGFL